MNKLHNTVLMLMLLNCVFAVSAFAQTTEFTYQGRLTDGAAAANGSFQMQFMLFSVLSGPGQVGMPITDVPVQVANGIFTVTLDFGSSPFTPGDNRFLEIAVRRNSGESYVVLTPREQIASSPFAIRTISAQTANTATIANSVAGQTSANNPNRVVVRDASGNFSAGTITANIAGAASANVLKTGDTMTGPLNLPSNGLTVGTNQLTVSGGNVGIGTTASLSAKLVVAGGPIVTSTDNGGVTTSATIDFGHRYRDNGIVAWARITSAGTIGNEFGVTSVTHSTAGSYLIQIDATAFGGTTIIPMAIANMDILPSSATTLRIVSVRQLTTSTFRVFINDGNGTPVDNNFLFMATGR